MVLGIALCAAARRRVGVLVNTPGGSASTALLEAFYKAGVGTNNRFNRYGNLKHANARSLEHRLGNCTASTTGRCLLADEGSASWAFDRVVEVVPTDAAKAVVSTARRWPDMAHQFHLQPNCGDCWQPQPTKRKRSRQQVNEARRPPTWRGKRGPVLYRAIFASSARLGRDAYGVQAHFDQWVAAQKSRHWPPILIVDIHTLLDPAFRCAFFRFAGLADDERRRVVVENLEHPDKLVTNLNRHKDGATSPDPADFMDATAKDVYANLSAAVSAVVAENRRSYAC